MELLRLTFCVVWKRFLNKRKFLIYDVVIGCYFFSLFYISSCNHFVDSVFVKDNVAVRAHRTMVEKLADVTDRLVE